MYGGRLFTMMWGACSRGVGAALEGILLRICELTGATTEETAGKYSESMWEGGNWVT